MALNYPGICFITLAPGGTVSHFHPNLIFLSKAAEGLHSKVSLAKVEVTDRYKPASGMNYNCKRFCSRGPERQKKIYRTIISSHSKYFQCNKTFYL